MNPSTPAIEALVALLPELENRRQNLVEHHHYATLNTVALETIIAAAKELAARDETHEIQTGEPQ